jgi:hypothetical protein
MFGMRRAFVPSVKTRLLNGAMNSVSVKGAPGSSKGGNMKKVLALVVLTSCLAVPSFAGDVVGHGVKTAGKDSAKAVIVTAKDSAKAIVHVGKFLF